MNQPEQDEHDIAALLQAAGRREQLRPELKQRWEQQFREQLQPVLARRQQRRRGLLWGLGACAAMLVAVLIVQLPMTVVDATSVRIAAMGGSVHASDTAGGELTLQPGQPLAVGTHLDTGEGGFISLDYGAYQLRLNQGSQLELRAHSLYLAAGALYASDDPGAAPGGLLIETPQGSIRDVGTQFMVEVFPERTVTTVRRGAIVLDTGDFEHRASATEGSASRLVADGERQVLTDTVAPSGPQWQWIYHGAAGFKLDGSSAYEFLQWSVAESGLALEFASERAEIRARSTILRGDLEDGNLKDLDPEQAVATVLATTDLRASVAANHRLRVALQPRR